MTNVPCLHFDHKIQKVHARGKNSPTYAMPLIVNFSVREMRAYIKFDTGCPISNYQFNKTSTQVIMQMQYNKFCRMRANNISPENNYSFDVFGITLYQCNVNATYIRIFVPARIFSSSSYPWTRAWTQHRNKYSGIFDHSFIMV